MNVNYYLL